MIQTSISARDESSLGIECPAGTFASQNARALALPTVCIVLIWSGNQASIVIERTCVMCTPRLRCTPEQSRQRNTPRFRDFGDCFYGERCLLGLLSSLS